MEFDGFRRFPIIDSHVHFVHPERMDEMLALMDEAGHARANLVCIPNPDATTHNPAALYFKAPPPGRVFISGALEYAPMLADMPRAGEILAGQVRALKAQGFTGLKLIEGKPQVRKLLPIPLDRITAGDLTRRQVVVAVRLVAHGSEAAAPQDTISHRQLLFSAFGPGYSTQICSPEFPTRPQMIPGSEYRLV